MLLSGWLALIGVCASSALGTPTAAVRNGTYVGVSVSSFKQEHFLGMPYAQPPLPPNLRFRAPLSLNSSWSGTRAAEKYSPICVGYPSGNSNDDLGYDLSEDCLTLNVVRPEGVKKGSNVPVLVWIYGGGFSMGGSADHRYNASWIVQQSVEMGQPIIFASLNYRVNILGFLYGDDVAAEHTGNFGLLDQRLALNWIHENIGAFGGDNSKVTIMGESAGAISVGLHLLYAGQPSTPLFRSAILESGSATTNGYSSASDYEPSYQSVLNATGCGTLTCLRALPLPELVAATNKSVYSWNPVVDGTFLPDRPSVLIASGRMVRVPLLLGQNTDEGTSFGWRNVDNVTALSAAMVNGHPHLSNASVAKLLELYPDDALYGCPYNTGDTRLTSGKMDKRSFSIGGDITMYAGRRLLAQTMSKTHDVFSYRFDQPPDNATVESGISHFQEVAYVFSNPLPTQNPLSTRPGCAALANYMTRAWASFAHNLDPNHTGLKNATYWPSYRKAPKEIVLRRHGNFVEDDDYRKDGIAFINTLGVELQH